MRRMIAPIALLLIALAFTPAPDPLVVGAVYPTQGGQGMGGVAELRGVRLAAERINEAGGVDGRPVRISLHPAETAEGAARAVREAAEAGATVVLGSYGSTISAQAARAAADLGLVFWETGAVGEIHPEVRGGGRFFRAVSSGESLGEHGVAFLRERLLPMLDEDPRDLRWGVSYVDDVYGRSVGLGAAEAIDEAGLGPAATFPYDLATEDYGALARRIGRAGVDVLVVSAYLEDGIALRRAMVDQELPLVASVGTSSSYCMHEFGAALGEDAVGLLASDKPDGDVLDPAALRPEAADALRWARAEYRERWDHELAAPALSGFAAAWGLFRHVLPAAGSADPAAVSRAALAADLPRGALPNGSGLRFAGPEEAEPGANLRAASVIWQWVEPGTRAVVWPPELATSPILPLRIT